MADHPTRNPDIPRGMPEMPFWPKPEYAGRFTADGAPPDPCDVARFDTQDHPDDYGDDEYGEEDLDGSGYD